MTAALLAGGEPGAGGASGDGAAPTPGATAWEPPLAEFTAYKATRLSDVVCRRDVRLFRDRLQTMGNQKSWLLDRSCRLEPEYADEIVSEKRTVRSPGQWTVTAKLSSVAGSAAEPVDLFCVTIHWPTSWLATRGYTSFTLGFESCEEAARWHGLVQRQLSAQRMRAASKGDSSTGHSSKPSYDEGVALRPPGSCGGAVARKTSTGFVAAALEHLWSSGSKEDKQLHSDDAASAAAAAAQQLLRQRHSHGGSRGSGPTSPGSAAAWPCAGQPDEPPPAPQANCSLAPGPEASFSSSADEPLGSCPSYGLGAEPGQAAAAYGYSEGPDTQPLPPQRFVEQRWVPYRHTNGVAIYHHRESSALCSSAAGAPGGAEQRARAVAQQRGARLACGSLGGAGDATGGSDEQAGSEYMASAIVRGCPDECLAVLMDLSSNTTILGPASRIELLEDGEERQVLRIMVEATGMARRLCAPREVIMERLFKREECGVDVILFSSCDEQQQQQLPPGASAVAPLGAQLAAVAATAAAAAAGWSAWQRLAALAAAGLASSLALLLVVLALLLAAGAVWQRWRRGRAAPGGPAAAAAAAGWLLGCALGWLRRLWYRPVRAYVQGGYTISPREDCNAVNSPECLVTCILKVDLCGCLGERSWLRPVADALGWVDAYVERMLMAVILVKDEVEQQRFLVQPFSMLYSAGAASSSRAGGSGSALTSAASSAGGDECLGADAAQAATLRDGYGQHIRQQQLLRQRRRAGQEAAEGLLAGSSARGPGPLGRSWGAGGAAHGELGGVSARSLSGLAAAELAAQRAGEAGGKGGAAVRQQGRLGRMASRIYSLRPRLRRGDTATGERVASSAAAAAAQHAAAPALYSHSASASSFKRTAPAAGSGAAADGPASAASAAAGAAGASADATGALDAGGTLAAGAGVGPGAAGPQLPDMSDPAAVLASLGLPADTAVVPPQYYLGGPHGPAAKHCSLHPRFWGELHVPGTPSPFKLRGASYLADRTKVDGSMPQFVLGSVELVETPAPTQHISRFLPSVRCNQAAYSFVVNLIIPGTPVLSLVAVFINEHHPDILDPPASGGGSGGGSGGRDSSSDSGDSSQRSGGEGAGPSHKACGSLHRLSSGSVGSACGGGAAALAAEQHDAALQDAGLTPTSRYETPVCGRSGDADSCSSDEDDEDACSHAGGGGSSAAAQQGATAAGSSDGGSYRRPADVSDWQPFDYVLHRFLHGGPATRTAQFKLIPHIAEGSWVIKQSVGTVPVILGNKLQTLYHQTDRYIEATVDVTSSSAAAYITGMVRGATKSLVIDLGFVLEGQRPEELPEALLGAFRLNHLDCLLATRIDTSRELPLLPRPLQHHQLAALQQAAQARLTAAAAGGAAAQPGAAPAGGGSSSTPRQRASVCGSAAGSLGSERQAQQASPALPDQQQQQQQQPAGVLQALDSDQLQQRCRNSLSTLEGGRTMTAHARSRSAASVDELISGPAASATDAMQLREQVLVARAIGCSFSAAQADAAAVAAAAAGQQQAGSAAGSAAQQPRHAAHGSSVSDQTNASGGGSSTGAACLVGAAPGDMHHPRSIKTSVAGAGSCNAAAADAAAAGGAAAGGAAAGGAAAAAAAAAAAPTASSAARQLFGSLLPFSSDRGKAGGDATPPAAAAGGDKAALLGCGGAVSSLSGCATPTAVHTPTAAAASAAGSVSSPVSASLGALGTASSMGHRSNHSCASLGTPTAAGQQSSGSVRSGHHHRTSSNSDACRTPVAAWPSSPPTAEQLSAKLSAAAYISRAHFAALAASAQRRNNARGPQQAASGSPASCSGLATSDSLCGSPGVTSGLSAAAAAGSSGVQPAADTDAGASSALAGWPGKRPRTSSSGISGVLPPDAAAPQHGQQQRLAQAGARPAACSSMACAGADLAAAGGRLPSSSGGASSILDASGAAAAPAPGSGAAVAAAAAAAAGGQDSQAPAAKRRFSHRRFASMGAV